jgi:hypothetical protein
MRKSAGFFDVAHLGPPPALPCPRCGTKTFFVARDGACSFCPLFPSTTTKETAPDA